MKLKSFMKVNNSTNTEYIVFEKGSSKTGNFKVLEQFTVNYLEKDIDKLNRAILKRMDYENRGAEVIYVSASAIENRLNITIEI